MKRFAFFLPLLAIALTVVSCSKPTPDPAPATTAQLLTRKWQMAELYLKSDAKQYAMPPSTGEEALMSFASGGTYSYYDGQDKKTKTGKWTLSNGDKTLTTVREDGMKIEFTLNAISKTDIELASTTVNLLKTNPTQEEENNILIMSFLLASLDKNYGGTIDFTKEPTPKTLQLVMKGKAQ